MKSRFVDATLQKMATRQDSIGVSFVDDVRDDERTHERPADYISVVDALNVVFSLRRSLETG